MDMGYIKADRLLELVRADKQRNLCDCQRINRGMYGPHGTFSVTARPVVTDFEGKRVISYSPLCYGDNYEEIVADALRQAHTLTSCTVQDGEIYLPTEINLWDEYDRSKGRFHSSINVKVVLPHAS
jgi:hypothetical protein